MKKYHFEILDELQRAIKLFDGFSYVQKLDVLHGNSVGQHFRHIIEFYQCLAEAFKTGSVDYDGRKRDFRIENSPQVALEKVEEVRYFFEKGDWQKSLQLKCYLGGVHCSIPSSVHREIVYLTEHSIHHFALIKVAITSCFDEIQINEHFGVAPSTIAFQQKGSF